MIFYYSQDRLIKRFIYRFITAIPFATLAFFWDELFWWGVLALVMVILIEVVLNSKKGYFKMNEDSIETLPLLAAKKMEVKEIKSTYVYNDEWTFKSEDSEIRINKKFIRKNQQIEAENKLNELRFKVNQSLNLSSI